MPTDAKVKICGLKPSELIRVALADLDKCDRDPQYEVYMQDWHSPGENGCCLVCFAGAVMAKSFGLSPDSEHHPDDFAPLVGARLEAVDFFRMGAIASGLTRCSVTHNKAEKIHEELEGREMACLERMEKEPCDFNLAEFTRALTWVAKQLEQRDL